MLNLHVTLKSNTTGIHCGSHTLMVSCVIWHIILPFSSSASSLTYMCKHKCIKRWMCVNLLHVVEPCELSCTDTDDTLIVPWGDSVMDGTPCNVGTRDMCINGICKVSSSSNTLFCIILWSFRCVANLLFWRNLMPPLPYG